MISPPDAQKQGCRRPRFAIESESPIRPVAPPDGPIDYFYEDEFADESKSHVILGPMPQSDQPTKSPPKGTPSYLSHLWTMPLLNRRQEYHCFRKLNYLKYLANLEWQHSEFQSSTAPRSEQFESLQESIIRVRNQIVECNLRLAVSLARRYAETSRVEFDELTSVGNMALLRSCDLFDFRRGLRFSTYAYQAIQRSIFNAIKGTAGSRMIEEAEGAETIEGISHDAASGLWAEKRYERAKKLVVELMRTLDPRERKIVMARFGIESDEDGISFRKISKEIGVSSTRTAQLYHRSIDRMRQALDEHRKPSK